jgi:hypothetical protein
MKGGFEAQAIGEVVKHILLNIHQATARLLAA